MPKSVFVLFYVCGVCVTVFVCATRRFVWAELIYEFN